VAIASNTNPHSLGGGAGMPGCVVLVSNLNEKVGSFALDSSSSILCFVCVFLIFLCYLLLFLFHPRGSTLSTPPSTYSLFKMITPHALFILFGMCSLLFNFFMSKRMCEQMFLHVRVFFFLFTLLDRR
jgi:hypothetical protein